VVHRVKECLAGECGWKERGILVARGLQNKVVEMVLVSKLKPKRQLYDWLRRDRRWVLVVGDDGIAVNEGCGWWMIVMMTGM
jgi:hypothetical protein